MNQYRMEATDIPMRVLKEPEEDTAEAEPQKPTITDMGDSQNSQFGTRAVFNPAWAMAKAELDKAKKYIAAPTMAPSGANVQQGPRGGWYYESKNSKPISALEQKRKFGDGDKLEPIRRHAESLGLFCGISTEKGLNWALPDRFNTIISDPEGKLDLPLTTAIKIIQSDTSISLEAKNPDFALGLLRRKKYSLLKDGVSSYSINGSSPTLISDMPKAEEQGKEDGVDAYHVTTLKNLKSIYQKGILAGFSNPFAESNNKQVYLARRFEGARAIGKVLAKYRGDSNFAILKIKLPPELESEVEDLNKPRNLRFQNRTYEEERFSPDYDVAPTTDPAYSGNSDEKWNPFFSFKGAIDKSWIVGSYIEPESKQEKAQSNVIYVPISLDSYMVLNHYLEKAKKYIAEPTLAPEGVQVQQGPKGGWYYESESRQLSSQSSSRESLGFYQDNPLKDYPNEIGAQRWMQENPKGITGKYTNIAVSPKNLIDIPGLLGEEKRIDMIKVNRLAANMQENGFNPNQRIQVEINQQGQPFIYEGNHRLRAALIAGIDKIPVDVNYLGGSEEIPNVFDPANFPETTKLGKAWISIPDPSQAPQGTQTREGPRGGWYYQSGGRNGPKTETQPQPRQQVDVPQKLPDLEQWPVSTPVTPMGQRMKGLVPDPFSDLTSQPIDHKVWDGKPVPIQSNMSSQESGAIGEAVALNYIKDALGMPDATYVNTFENTNRSNMPMDLISPEGKTVFEVKTGFAGNSVGAQYWRVKPGEKSDFRKQMDRDPSIPMAVKREQNFKDIEEAVHRKFNYQTELNNRTGDSFKLKTLTLIHNPDTQEMDIYEFDGVHKFLYWNKSSANYKGSVKYDK